MFGSISLIHYLNKHLLSTHSVPAGVEDKRMSKMCSGPKGVHRMHGAVEEKTRKSPYRARLQWAWWPRAYRGCESRWRPAVLKQQDSVGDLKWQVRERAGSTGVNTINWERDCRERDCGVGSRVWGWVGFGTQWIWDTWDIAHWRCHGFLKGTDHT